MDIAEQLIGAGFNKSDAFTLAKMIATKDDIREVMDAVVENRAAINRLADRIEETREENRAAIMEATRENRAAIIEAAKENRTAINRLADRIEETREENRAAIIEAAKENRTAIIEAAKENRAAINRLADKIEGTREGRVNRRSNALWGIIGAAVGATVAWILARLSE